MSSIPFLDNADHGKNKWWRYLITIIVSMLGAAVVAGLILALFIIIYFLSSNFLEFNLNFSLLEIQSNSLFILIMVAIYYILSYLLFYICFIVLHHRKFISLINIMDSVRWRNILKGLILWMIILLIFILPTLIFAPNEYRFTFNPQNYLILLLLSLITFPIQASFEEIFFRGYLLQAFGRISKKPLVPLILSSLFFGLLHYFNSSDPSTSFFIVGYTFILGMMLGVIVLGENGIETAIGVHISNNMFVSLFFNSSDSGLGDLPSLFTSTTTDLTSSIPFIIIAALLMIGILFWNKKENLYPIFRLKG